MHGGMNMKVKEMCLITLMSILIAAGAFIKLPISIVPVTLQTLFVVLAGLVLGKKAIYSVLLYIMIGLLGIPVFTNGGGPAYVLMPSFGYLLGFIICAYLVGKHHNDKKTSLVMWCLIGMLVIYLIGMIYFVMIEYLYYQQIFSISYVFVSLFLVYLPGDILSIIVALIVYDRLKAIHILDMEKQMS